MYIETICLAAWQKSVHFYESKEISMKATDSTDSIMTAERYVEPVLLNINPLQYAVAYLSSPLIKLSSKPLHHS